MESGKVVDGGPAARRAADRAVYKAMTDEALATTLESARIILRIHRTTYDDTGSLSRLAGHAGMIRAEKRTRAARTGSAA